MTAKDGPQSPPRHPRARPAGPSSSQELFAKRMDCRVKPGNDDCGSSLAMTKKTARFELPSPRGLVAMPRRHVLHVGRAERAGMEKLAVVVRIEMVRLHEPHQSRCVDG